MPVHDLPFRTPLMNAAGSLGFAPDVHGPVDLKHFGAFVTNPVSAGVRTPANGERWLAYPGGFLLHTGYPNPGLPAVIRHYAAHWARAPLPVLVHLLGQSADRVAYMVRWLENLEGVLGIELGVPPDAGVEMVTALAQAAQGELPVIVCLPLERAVELAQALAGSADAFSLAPPRGVLPGRDGTLVGGRLYGPSIFPLALSAVRSLAHSGLRVIGAGGVYQSGQVEAMLAAGAVGVQLDAVLWRGGFDADDHPGYR